MASRIGVYPNIPLAECLTLGMDENECWAHEEGWKDGYEWILTELAINKEISAETLKKYMDKLL